jgi:hypothetical protein
VDGDCGKLISLSNAAAVAVTLPQANGSTFVSGWSVDFQNKGAGTVTVTPTTSTINGGASQALAQNQGMHCQSDGTNYTCMLGVGAGGGAGTVTQVVCGNGLSGGTITASGTCALALNTAITDQSPSNPTGTTSVTPVMMGIGKDQAGAGAHSCTITPVVSTRVRFSIDGTLTNSASGNATALRANFGTGIAPSNGVAQTGTQIGNLQLYTSSAANSDAPAHIEGVITGLTVGTAYWFDAAVNVGAGTGAIIDVHCVATEQL